MNTELLEFTRQALEKGLEPPAISQALRQAGWAEADIAAALATFASVDFPVPVPRVRRSASAAEVFIYLIMFVALFTSAYSLGALLFQFIEQAFPDPLHQSYAGEAEQLRTYIRWNLSALIVSFPLFLLTFRSIARGIAGDPGKRDSWPRKWLTYGTLFIAVVCLIGDITTLVYNALGGELTIRFTLKVATVALIAGGILLFFLIEMRKDEAR